MTLSNLKKPREKRMATIDMTSVTPIRDLAFVNAEEKRDMDNLIQRATAYLGSFSWCAKLHALYSGIAVGDVLGVFLAHIEPTHADVDKWLWVIIGDLPPAYLVTDEARTPDDALEAYISEMRTWVEAVLSGEPVEELIPVNAEPTEDYANMLGSRLNFLESRVLRRGGFA
jgi:hypothetical protein